MMDIHKFEHIYALHIFVNTRYYEFYFERILFQGFYIYIYIYIYNRLKVYNERFRFKNV